jgi:hypothetical protein
MDFFVNIFKKNKPLEFYKINLFLIKKNFNLNYKLKLHPHIFSSIQSKLKIKLIKNQKYNFNNFGVILLIFLSFIQLLINFL